MSAMTDSGAIASRCGGRVAADEELADARSNEMPDHADLAVLDPGLRSDRLDDVVAIAVVGRSNRSNAPPEQPEPRMFTPTVAYPSALASSDTGCGLSGSAVA